MSTLRRSVAFATQTLTIPVPKNRRVSTGKEEEEPAADKCAAQVRTAPQGEPGAVMWCVDGWTDAHQIIDLNNVPLVSGTSFVKWHLSHSTAAEHRGRTQSCPVRDHKVV